MNRKIILTLIGLFLSAAISLVVFWPNNQLHLIVCNVGQGDAILLTHGFDQVLVDGGPNDKVLGCLARHMPFWDREIEVVVNTHPENDHLRGLVSVIQRYTVKQLIINSQFQDSEVFNQFQQVVLTKKISVHSPKQGEKIKIGGLELAVLWPDQARGDIALWTNPLLAKEVVLGAKTKKENPNESAIVLEAKYGKFRALLTGDIPDKIESLVVNYCQAVDCASPVDVLKVSHHGSKTSTTQAFLAYFQPKEAIISVGANSFGHPTQEVLDRLTAVGSKILRTDLRGDVEITAP